MSSLGGDTAEIIANAEGDNLRFQWYRGESIDRTLPLEGKSSRILEIDFVREEDEGGYRGRVYNESESLDSQAAVLSVDYPIESSATVLAGWHARRL